MIHLKKKRSLQISVFALLLLVLTVIPTWAYQGSIGGSPYAADLLVSGLNTGTLDPGQEHWYAYSRLDLGNPEYNGIILSLNFEAEGVAVANRVNFQVFTFQQVEAWLRDSSGPVDNLGLGSPASTDFDVNTGERLWSGPVEANDVYYVRIFNLSPSPVQFRLTALGQKTAASNAFMALNPQTTATGASPVIPASASMPGATNQTTVPKPSIAAALPVNPNDGSNASTSWLLAAQAIHGLPPQEAAAWLMSAAMLGWLPGANGANGAAGAEPSQAPAAVPPPVPVQPDTGPLAAVEPGGGAGGQAEPVAAVPVQPEPAPNPNSGESIYPNRPLRLLDGPNTGRLGPKTEHWYTFTPGKVDGKLIENYSLTMFFTPGEPNLARHITFEMFTGDQYPIWSRGTPDDMEHFGAGSWLSRDGDYITGERLWHGTVVDGDQYYVKLTNGTSKWVDYHLVPGDIINMELGEPKIKPVKAALVNGNVSATGEDIGAPLVAKKGSNAGKLPARDELWLSFKTPNSNSEDFEFLPYLFELTHKPGYGTVANGVNVEIYPYQEQQIWRRGDGDQIKPLGVGSYTEYNETADTHTWVWNGHLVSNTIYFVQVRNGSPHNIDYDLVIRRR